ncbi:MAG: M15 family metallopeptidase [Eggerthellaceae bacterium]|nr:M15 family metallopeptidase [Eggerthellaceae bacterium]
MGKSKVIAAWAAIVALVLVLSGCGGNAASSASSSEASDAQPSQASSAPVSAEQSEGVDYLALVNKLNPLPEGWEDALQTEHFTNTVGDDVEVESKAYAAYLDLKADLEKEGVYVDLDSARRSVADQERIMAEFTEEHGADYAKKTVAAPGYSEHHTGLALDLYLIIDGEDVVENEDMMQYPEVWEKIHARLADHGFILRYLDGDEHITGYGYEPWHIRYIDDPAIAKEITGRGITFEEYKAGKVYPEVSYDYGDSKLYTREELEEAAIQVKCSFAAWDGCELHSLRYAGDGCNTPENVKWLNEIDEGAGYAQVVELLGDFHSPTTEDEPTAWNLDTEYTDYQWWLGRTEDGGWQLVTSGY